jgi:hypothetical protein
MMDTSKTKKEFDLDSSVMWDGDPEDAGIVTKVTDTAVYIEWDNGQSGWLDKRDLEMVTPLTVEVD